MRRAEGITFLYEQESGPDRANEPMPGKGEKELGMPPGNPGFGNLPERDSMNPSSGKVIPTQMSETLRDNLTYSASARRVAARYASECNPSGISYAWIDPHGKVHKTRRGHEQWATEFIHGVPSLLEEYQKLDAHGTPGQVLSKNGWIRFANFTGMTVWAEDEPSAQAWASAAKLVVKCTLSHRDIDPFEPLIWVGEDARQGRAEVYSIDEFLKKWGSRRESEQLFDKLMARTGRARTAATLDEILSNKGPSVMSKAPGVQVSSLRFSPDSGLWVFKATGSKGEVYKIRIKGFRKGNTLALSKLQVKVSCTCPFWQWQGPEHWGKANKYLYGKPRGTAANPEAKDPKGQHWCCKHVAAALEKARGYSLSKKPRGKRGSADGWDFSGLPVPMPSPERVAQRHLGEARG